MSLGQVMQAASRLHHRAGRVSPGWPSTIIRGWRNWNASARRIASLMVSLDALEQAETGDAFNRIKRGETTDAAIAAAQSLGPRSTRAEYRRFFCGRVGRLSGV